MTYKIAVLLPLFGLSLASAWGATGQLDLTVVDKDTGKPVACRMHLAGPNNNKPRKVDKAPFWQDHFVFPGHILLKLPLGNYTFVIERGLEYLDQHGSFTFNAFAEDSKQIELHRFVDMSAEGWWSGDLDVRRPVGDIELLMSADDLHVAEVISWTNDKSQWSGKSPPKQALVRFDGNRYYHLMAGSVSRAGGEVLFFHLPTQLSAPEGNAEYPPLAKVIKEAMNLAQKSPLPTNLRSVPGEGQGEGKADVWVDVTRPFWWDLPVLVALGQVDSIQVAHGDICRETVIPHETGGKPRDMVHYPNPFGNPLWSQYIYFQLLECGLHIPPSAGSGSGVAPNPVGQNRMYVHVDGDFSYEKWWQSFRAGQVVITNGPLMRPKVDGELPGHVFQAEAGGRFDFEIGLTISIRDPISYLEIIKDGQVAESVRFDEYAKSGKLPNLHFDHSGWFLLRAITDVGKTFRFAMTAPYYVEIGYKPRISKKAAQFFLDWVYERAKQIKLDDPQQQREALDLHRQARDFWQEMIFKANAE
ncbi:MAG: hypothetical protein ABSA16_14775 [Thermoguttaceae bacterium]|jgi:hypothetical protein